MRSAWYLSLVFGFVCVMWLCSSVVAFGSDGRVFELVSPIYKGGFGATHIEAVAQNGDSVAFYSPGAFNGAPAGLSSNIDSLDYLASRGESGWSTVPIAPPDSMVPDVTGRDISATLGATLAVGKRGATLEAAVQEGTEAEFLLHDTGLPDIGEEDWELAGMVLKTVHPESITLSYLGGSDDFCHIFFESRPATSKKNSGVLLEKADSAQPQVYELSRGCNGEPVVLRLVGLNGKGNIISPNCGIELGVEDYKPTGTNEFNSVSADGGTAFFTTCVENEVLNHQLFARLGGSRTVEISKPLTDKCGSSEIPCKGTLERPSADFAGASEDGLKVYFTTSAALTGEEDNTGNNLYVAELGCPAGGPCEVSEQRVTSLVQISRDTNGGDASVMGVVRVAPNGSRVYFVANGDLLSGAERLALEGAGRPVPEVGADNLYAYDGVSGEMEFVSDLCSGYSQSGTVDDSHCPNRTQTDERLWLGVGDASEAQTGGASGEYLVFPSYGQLADNDTDTAKDVYRYDALTGVLSRVSVGENGYEANGNNNNYDASISLGHLGGFVRFQDESENRAISEEGSRIVFTTAEPLSPSATNGLVNVYEWYENSAGGGNVSLLSGGSGDTPVEDSVMDPTGTNAFFVTAEGLVRQDTDGAPDVYDARLGGGFVQSPTPPERCEDEACQGALTNPAPLLVPGSVSQTPGEDVVTPAKTATPIKAKKKSKVPKRKAKIKKRRKGSTSRRSQRGKISGYVGGKR